MSDDVPGRLGHKEKKLPDTRDMVGGEVQEARVPEACREIGESFHRHTHLDVEDHS
jgi:hypothetical protein